MSNQTALSQFKQFKVLKAKSSSYAYKGILPRVLLHILRFLNEFMRPSVVLLYTYSCSTKNIDKNTLF